MSLKQYLDTGAVIEAWGYEEGLVKGITIGLNDHDGTTVPLLHVESLERVDGYTYNRVIVNKRLIETHDFKLEIIPEEGRKRNV